MSVFSDFQRLWVQRFPQSSLSDAWEQDVRASLERHRQRIAELQKDLEQETLYVEYLERLLSDVEKYREAGGDPTALFEAATTSQSQATPLSIVSGKEEGNGADGSENNSRAGTEDTVAGNIQTKPATDDNRKLEEGLFRSSSETVVTRGGDRERSRDRDSISRFGRYTKSQQSDSSGVATILAESQDEHEDKDAGTEKDFRNMQIQKNGALNQCINELTSNRRLSLGDSEKNINKQDSTSAAESSHFVTVIEVKESKDAQENENSSSQKIVQQMSTSSGGGDSSESEATVSMGSFERKHSATAIEPTAPPMSPSNSTSVIASASGSPSISALQPSGTNLEGKKKVPPSSSQCIGRKGAGRNSQERVCPRRESPYPSSLRRDLGLADLGTHKRISARSGRRGLRTPTRSRRG